MIVNRDFLRWIPLWFTKDSRKSVLNFLFLLTWSFTIIYNKLTRMISCRLTNRVYLGVGIINFLVLKYYLGTKINVCLGWRHIILLTIIWLMVVLSLTIFVDHFKLWWYISSSSLTASILLLLLISLQAIKLN